jgi:Gcd10p family.
LKEVEKEDLDLNLGGEEGEENEKEDEEDDKDEREEPSNKDMFDNNQAQKLTEAEIEEMKKGGENIRNKLIRS